MSISRTGCVSHSVTDSGLASRESDSRLASREAISRTGCVSHSASDSGLASRESDSHLASREAISNSSKVIHFSVKITRIHNL